MSESDSDDRNDADGTPEEAGAVTETAQPSESTLQLAKPISDAEPCGENVRYDPDFERIKSEIDKISENDFKLIEELSEKLLREKTKDLLVASYYALGLTRTVEVAGLAEGLSALALIADTFWDDMFPPANRMTARRNAIQFFAEKASAGLEGYRPVEADRAQLELALARLEAFQAFTLEKMEDSAPTLSGLKRVLRDIERRIPKKKTAPTDSSQDAAGGIGSPTEVGSVSDANLAVNRAVTFLREKDRTNAVPYRVLRALRWSAILGEPQHDSGVTRLPAPPEQRRAYFSSLLEQGDSEKLIAEGEAFFQDGTNHFWIDLQRLIAAAMQSAGDNFEGARTAVLEETGILMNRVPGLANLMFADRATPFISPLTADWISSDVLPLFSSAESARSAPGPLPEAEDLEVQKKEAARLLQKGDLSDAISHMREGSENDRSAREHFVRQLYVADLCMKGGRPAVARPILESLDKDIEVHGLDSWDPDLALTAWTALHSCYRALGASGPAATKEQFTRLGADVFEKVCRVDAAYALSLPEK